MPRLTDKQLDRAEVKRTVRAVARIHANNALARFLNEVENDMLDQYDRALAAGEPFVPDYAAVGERFQALELS